MALRVGIPNRSSLLHTAGAVQCIQAGIIPSADYSSTRLMYHSQHATTVLSRCETLCQLLLDDKLDMVFVGGDYARECLGTRADLNRVDVNVFSARFALISASGCDISSIQVIYTKFPQTALSVLNQRAIEGVIVRQIPGACEAMCLIDQNAAAFDIVCTGDTVLANGLNVIWQGEPFTPSWSINCKTPRADIAAAQLQKMAGADAALSRWYSEYFRGRVATQDVTVRSLTAQLGITDGTAR
jgi:ATP phosphoribosyltransferase